MIASGPSEAACAWRGRAIAALIAAAIAWLSTADVNAGPIRRMYRRAARSAVYAPSYPAGNYAPAVGYANPVYPPTNFTRFAPPFGPFSPVGPGNPPPPYYLFSGILRPGFGPPWGGPFPGAGPSANSDQPPMDGGESREQISDQEFVSGLYRDILGREPDEPGVTAWVQALRRGMSRRAVTNYFLNSRERTRPRPARPLEPPALSNEPRGATTETPIIEEPNQPAAGPRIFPAPEVIPPAEQAPVDGEQPLDDTDAEVLPEEVPVPPAAAPPKREREF